MRQGQQNRRGRGRGRKNQNPLSRNYESNGPDVKIRGTASHVAEKYSALARDALSSGDPITAENYFQHAEHYNRIIMAAQAQNSSNSQQQPATEAINGSGAPQPDLADASQPEHVKSSSAAEEAPKRRRRRPTGTGNGTSKPPANSNVEASSSKGNLEKSGKANGLEVSDDTESPSGEIPPDGIVV